MASLEPNRCHLCGTKVEPFVTEFLGRPYVWPRFVCDARECVEEDKRQLEAKELEEHLKKAAATVPAVIAQTDRKLLPSEKARTLTLWRPWDKEHKSSLYLCGPSRTGKSRVMAQIAITVAAKWRVQPVWCDAWMLEDLIQAKPHKLLEAASQKLLCIDDLGKEKMTEKMASAIFKVIDFRCSNNFTTLITSNWTPTVMAERFHDTTIADAVKGRLTEFYDRVLLDSKELPLQ